MTRHVQITMRHRTILVALCAVLIPGGIVAQEQKQTPTQTGTPAAERSAAGIHDLTPEQFAQACALSGLKEIRLSETALRKTQDSEIRQFARQLVQDHSQANQQLTQIATRKGITLPSTNAFDQTGIAGSDRRYVRGQDTAIRPGQPTTPQPSDRSVRDQSAPTRDSSSTLNRQQGRADLDASQKQLQMQEQTRQTIRRLEMLSGTEFDRAYVNEMVQDHAKAVKKFEAASRNLQDAELKQFAAETLPKLQQHYAMAQNLGRTRGGLQGSPDQIPGQPEQQRQPQQPDQK